MVRGLFASASGALVAQSQVDVIANNLANVNTNGFKRVLLQAASAPSLDIYRFQTDPADGTTGSPTAAHVGSLGFGAQVYGTTAVFEQGSLEHTGNPLDLAVQGNGFLTVQTPQGIRYTRDGQLARDAQGYLVTMDGDRVLGRNGAIVLPAGDVQVSKDGTISQQGRQIDAVRVTQFASIAALRPEGSNRFVDSGGARPAPAAAFTVNQGFLEKSNANVVRSMVDLITAERWFEANQKSMQTQDDATASAISEVSRTSSH
ncbi:MAG: flagellar basal-body rod protein FlgF [Candidatus Eremiobacteraeota bacterium]|nr:flagellar basal-body rod protein FlgF [Candidatus Eremiobacteraeota bacterium]